MRGRYTYNFISCQVDYSHNNFEIGTKDNVGVSTEVSCCITSVSLRAVDLTGEEYNNDFMEGAGAGEWQSAFGMIKHGVLSDVNINDKHQKPIKFILRFHLRHGIWHTRRHRVGDLQLGRIDGPANQSGAEIRIKIPFLCCFLSEIRVFVRSETEP